MKWFDKVLRRWRVNAALKVMPDEVNAVFDIGCDDGYLLNRVNSGKMCLEGCDPRLPTSTSSPGFKLSQGFFPSVLDNDEHHGPYDAIFALAVFEHFTEDDLLNSSHRITEMLSDHGRLIVTVPHPFVDKILDVLMFLKLIDGQALEEHHGFDPEDLVNILSRHFRLVTRKKFQLGLNNLFVFEKS